jgi:outer membrane protein with beta-barrel domain
MRSYHLAISCLLVLAFGVSPADAQQRRRAAAARAPAPGMVAVGASIGADLPMDPSLDNGLDVAGTIEGYLTSRVSVRGQVGAGWWDIVGHRFTGQVKPIYFDGNLVYNWEGGAIHPYVTAGLGMYKFRSTEAGAVEGSDTKAGFNIGGGLEYFFTPRATFTGEALYHKVEGFNTPLAGFGDGSFWRLALGMKAYF